MFVERTLPATPQALSTGEPKTRFDAESLILHGVRRKLLGRTVKASGSVVQAWGRLYFFPKTVEGVS